jgi:hypothetical protein
VLTFHSLLIPLPPVDKRTEGKVREQGKKTKERTKERTNERKNERKKGKSCGISEGEERA